MSSYHYRYSRHKCGLTNIFLYTMYPHVFKHLYLYNEAQAATPWMNLLNIYLWCIICGKYCTSSSRARCILLLYQAPRSSWPRQSICAEPNQLLWVQLVSVCSDEVIKLVEMVRCPSIIVFYSKILIMIDTLRTTECVLWTGNVNLQWNIFVVCHRPYM